MALILCAECNKQISNKAVACPQCGCPLSETDKAITVNGYQPSSINLSSSSESPEIKTVSGGASSGIESLSGCLLAIGVIMVIGVLICMIFVPHVGIGLMTLLAIGRVLVYANNKG